MSVFHFQSDGFNFFIEGINGGIAKDPNNDQPIAESCNVEVVEDDTFKKWKKCIKKKDLDGVVLRDVPDIVSAIKNAFDDDIPTISITLCEMSNGDLSMILSFPVLLRTTSIEFSLELVQQDEIAIMKQCLDFLTVRLGERKQQQHELKEREKNQTEFLRKVEEDRQKEKGLLMEKIIALEENEQKMQKEFEKMKTFQEKERNERELLKKIIEEEKKIIEEEKKITEEEKKIIEEEKKIIQQEKKIIEEKKKKIEEEKKKEQQYLFDKMGISQERKFVECGEGLSISNCGMMVAQNGSDSFSSVTVGETMSDGIYYAEFMTLRMHPDFDLRCGVLPSTETNLTNSIRNMNGGFGFDTHDGSAFKPGSSWISTGLPKCNQMNGSIIAGVLLNLEKNKIQFFLNGVASDSSYDIDAGEYKFAVTLYYQWDAIKLLRIEKQK